MSKLREMGRRQKGYFIAGPTTGELLFAAAFIAGFFIGLGVLLSWFVPKVWAWVKPWLHAVTG